jgi:hypothetical protein
MKPTLTEIVAAYQAQDFKPIRRIFTLHAKGVDHVCPLVALAIHRGVVDRADPGIEIDGGANLALSWGSDLWSFEFVVGILDGWDGQEQAKDIHDYVEGYQLGVAAAQQLSPLDPGL